MLVNVKECTFFWDGHVCKSFRSGEQEVSPYEAAILREMGKLDWKSDDVKKLDAKFLPETPSWYRDLCLRNWGIK